MQVTPSRSHRCSTPSAIQREGADLAAPAAGHERLLDAQGTESRIGPTAGSSQIDTAATVTSPTLRVVLRESLQLGLLLLGLRLRLLGLQAKISVLALQRSDALSQKRQVLAEHRRRCVLVDQRLQFFEQRLKHHVALHLFGNGHRSGEVL